VNANPKIMKAFLDALEESMTRIKSDPAKAAAIWVKAENSKLSPADAEKIIRNPQNEWTTTPKKVLTYLDYMNRAGLVATKTTDWKDIFFSGIHGVPGS
jgi:NitT/TauT family transport system substrate-binding protein